MNITLHPSSVDDYHMFIRAKSMPRYRFTGRNVFVPDEYAKAMGLGCHRVHQSEYKPISGLFDYQRAIAEMAIARRKFAIFADCGLGKTLMLLEYARHVRNVIGPNRRVLIVSPLMVVRQTIAESTRFYGDDFGIERVPSSGLNEWLDTEGSTIGITNWEALRDDVRPGKIGALVIDESSMLKSAYGKYGQRAIELGKGLDWKLALSGTPAPNDRIEYANHAVFLDAEPTVNSFYAKYFINRGQTANRWEMKPHALIPFYRSLSAWSIFLTNPATYGWKDNIASIPGINVHIHDVDMTQEQEELTFKADGRLFPDQPGGIGSRSVASQIAKGNHKGKSISTNKPGYIKSLTDSWPGESTIIWCIYNAEQKAIASMFPDAANIDGGTPIETRESMIADFQAGRRKILISKGEILGFGLNLQIATRQIFSGIEDSYETYWQCVKRSNRYGSAVPLNVHIPITEIERPMVETVLKKASRIQADTSQQEEIFKNAFA